MSWSRPSAAVLVAAACIVIAPTDPALSATAGGGKAGAKGKRAKKKLVVAPRAGSVRRPGSLHILVRARPPDRVRVRLNGVATGGGLSRIDHGRLRKLRLSPDHGLRHGRNVLRVTVKPRGARRARTQVVRFRVVGKRPLAAAGRDRRIAAHARIRLKGRSLLHPQARRRRSGIRYRWRVVRAPKGSKLAKRRGRARARALRRGKGRTTGGVVNLAAPAMFAGRNSSAPRFRPDAPGDYLIELRTTHPKGSVSKDTVAIEVDPDPLVAIDTMAKPNGQSNWGVKVGTQFYPDPGASKQWLQVVALESDTLELISNTSYDCPQATANPFANQEGMKATEPCRSRVSADLEKLRKQRKTHPPLVIGVSQRIVGDPDPLVEAPWVVQPPVGALTALNAGVPGLAAWDQVWLHNNNAMVRGRLSAIGSARRGSTTVHRNPDLGDFRDFSEIKMRDDGEIVGLLLRDNRGEYTSYASLEHPRFETQAPGSDGTQNVIRVGDSTFTEKFPPGSIGGFHLVLVERQRLSGESYWFDSKPSSVAAELRAIREKIVQFDAKGHDYLVFLASRGDPRMHKQNPNESQKQIEDAAEQLVDTLVNKIGATYTRAFRAIDPGLAGNHSYTLVAQYGTGPARAPIEVEGIRPATDGVSLSATPAVGTLTRSKTRIDYGFDVEAAHVGSDLGGAAARKLRELAFSPTGSWPEQDSKLDKQTREDRTGAIAWVAEKAGLDPRRGHFWTNPPNFDWDAKIKAVEGLAYPGSAGFTKKAFMWAQSELVDEIGWFKTARGFVADLAEPFKGNSAGAQWALFSSIATKINKEVNIPPKNLTAAELGLVLQGVLNVALTAATLGEGEKVAAVVEGVAELIQLGLEWGQLESENGGEAGESFEVTAAEFGEKLQARLTLAQKTLENQLLFVVAADYRKLRTVGLCAGLDPQCPDKPLRDWQFTRDDQKEAEEALDEATREFVTGSLLTAKYKAFEMPRSRFRKLNVNGEYQVAGLTELFPVWFCSFHDFPDTAQVSFPVRREFGSTTGIGDNWRVFAYGERTGTGSYAFPVDPYQFSSPKATVTDPLFKPRDAGGLGLEREPFFWHFFGKHNEPVGSFPHQASPVEWISKDSPIGVRDKTCGW